MQANEFEKQVSQKMDELNFTPSSPVWTNIEEELRKKKERRRLLFWIPVFLLLLTSGGYWLLRNNNSSSLIAVDKQEKAPLSNPNQPSLHKTTTGDIIVPTTPTAIATSNANVDLSGTGTKQTSEKSLSLNASRENKFASAKNFSASVKKIKASKKNNKFSSANDTNNSVIVNDNIMQTPVASQTHHSKAEAVKDNTASHSIDTTKTKTETIKDTIIVKDSLQKKDIKPKRDARWTAGLVVFGGASGINSGATIEQASFNGPLLSANGPAISLPVAKPKNKLAFSVGFSATKSISHRVSFLTGLQYNFTSNSIDIGARQTRDTIISANYSAPVRVTQYYSKGLSGKDYVNNYNFISIPVGLEVKLFSHVPVYVHAGFTVHQLVATNALVYSNRNGVYYHDKNAFHKTQLASTMGIHYQTGIKGRRLTLGPQFQYHWTQLQKDASVSRHLFSVGLNARMELIKL